MTAWISIPIRRLVPHLCLLLLGLGLWTTPIAASAQDAGPAAASTPHIKLSLLSEQATLTPGRQAWIGLRFVIKKDWHIYWRNPGDSGYPPSATWDLPPGAGVGEIVWPAPERLPFGPLVNFGYSDDVMFALPVQIAADYAGSSLTLRAQVKWLVCEQVCIPEDATLALTLPVATQASDHPGTAPLFAATRSRWPQTVLPPGWQLSAHQRAQGGALLALRGSAATALTFFPFAEGEMNPAAEQTAWHAEATTWLTLAPAEVPLGPWQRLHGVLVAKVGAGGTAAYTIDLPLAAPLVPEPVRPVSVSAQAPTLIAVLAALLLAFAGGALLNLMPCVLPVLSIKLLALINHPDDVIAARQHARYYSLGVVLSFLALAAVLLLLRAAGASLGWGFQLQAPAVVGALALLFFALGLSLSGALPIATLAQDAPSPWRRRHPRLDALASGGLAVLVASPCTAPFMGAALGAALTMPAAATLLVFAALGLGMALPFALLVRYPVLRRWLPRPGAWMERLKEFLALPLYATVVWLGWVLAEQIGASAVITLGSGLLCIALLAWCLHLRSKLWRRSGATLALSAALLSMLWPMTAGTTADSPTVGVAADASSTAAPSGWQPWSPAAQAEARASGHAVFVDFTAAWCVTCQVNKRLVLDRAAAQAEFAARKVVLLRADWTRHDPAITAELTRLGRSGVPVYALYPPKAGDGDVVLLPEILTPSMLSDALGRLPRS